MANHNTFKRQLRRLHRYLGAVAAVFVAVLTVTGILLNHTEDFQLDQQYLNSPWLLSWYGIETDPVTSFTTAAGWLSSDGYQLYLNAQPVGECQTLTGAVFADNTLVASCHDRLLLLTREGQLIETVDSLFGLPTPVNGLNTAEGTILLFSDAQPYRFDTLALSFTSIHSELQPQQPAQLPAGLLSRIQHQAKNRHLSLERLVQDIHSGRILGLFGVLLMDGAALLLIFMAFSGLWIWLKKR